MSLTVTLAYDSSAEKPCATGFTVPMPHSCDHDQSGDLIWRYTRVKEAGLTNARLGSNNMTHGS
jgi:hypothetical protein